MPTTTQWWLNQIKSARNVLPARSCFLFAFIIYHNSPHLPPPTQPSKPYKCSIKLRQSFDPFQITTTKEFPPNHLHNSYRIAHSNLANAEIKFRINQIFIPIHEGIENGRTNKGNTTVFGCTRIWPGCNSRCWLIELKKIRFISSKSWSTFH